MLLCLTCLSLLLAGCGTAGAGQQTLVAEGDAWGTEYARLYATATLGWDILQRTLEYSQTQVGDAQQRYRRLLQILIARGADPTALANFTPVPGALFIPTAAPTPFPGAAVGATPAPGAPLTPTPDLGGVALSSPVLSAGVGDDDCALAAQTQFSAGDAAIYVVATAWKIERGVVLSSRWLANGAEVARYDYAPDFVIDGRCVWFYIESSTTPFTPGAWQVELSINYTVVAVLDFSIVP